MAQDPLEEGWGTFSDEVQSYTKLLTDELGELATESEETKRIIEEAGRAMGNALVISFAEEATALEVGGLKYLSVEKQKMVKFIRDHLREIELSSQAQLQQERKAWDGKNLSLMARVTATNLANALVSDAAGRAQEARSCSRLIICLLYTSPSPRD